ncbi:hypothetical protein E2C01_028495 [Portunus trituberculatus]|uniref:Uncharacterized protein n=1 Tax=Portunus trituberculatus TaxID=210409 RepID=A0A5B7EKT0_PORTR|nr:hypothetical protein [Portunus trituberculatus]
MFGASRGTRRTHQAQSRGKGGWTVTSSGTMVHWWLSEKARWQKRTTLLEDLQKCSRWLPVDEAPWQAARCLTTALDTSPTLPPLNPEWWVEPHARARALYTGATWGRAGHGYPGG